MRFRLDQTQAARHLQCMYIYKILRQSEWDSLQALGETTGAPIDLQDGYIHFSTTEQAAETAAKHFANVDGLMLLACDPDRLQDALKWEPSRGGALFPHLYTVLKLSDVAWAKPLLFVKGQHQFPKDMA